MDIEADLRSMMSDMAWKEVMDMAFRVMKEMFENSLNPPTSLEEMGVALEMLGETFPEIPNPPSSPCLHLNNDVPTVGLPRVMLERLVPFGFVNTEAVDGIQANTALPTAPDTANDAPPYTRISHQPHIKKPPKAFMIFRKEQRPVVVAELQNGDSASVNTILGQRWKALSKDQQAKYYNQAEMERQLHDQLHPEWSTSKNDGKKRKRVRRNVPTRTK